MKLLSMIDASEKPMTQGRADSMLARIAWARITEPGDGTAGLLITAVGAERALDLLVQGADGEVFQNAIKHGLRNSIYDGKEISDRTIRDAIARWSPRIHRGETTNDIERAARARLRVLFPGDERWPEGLDDLGIHAPNMLWLRGQTEHLQTHSLAVVGARAATGYGSHVTAELVDAASRSGVAIVSGAAYGIDAVAHRTALAVGAPTIAVVAGGADRPYPLAHEGLLKQISEAGVVCSEMIPGSAPTRWRFLQRNRLIAALSPAVLITEAGVNSGSINTAGHASQLGRQIGAVPGPITSAASAGCHKLIRDYGALIVTSEAEVRELAGLVDSPSLFETDAREGAWSRRVCDALPLRGYRELEEISKLSGLSPEHTRGILSELELLGRVKRRESKTTERPAWCLVS